ncbi:MAG: AI-2E family transporter [Gammaproteobacteria bacterium]|nr:AI-2E family transporter [Gammaproteobacteria bacterium]
MVITHKSFISVLLTLSIVFLTIYVVHHFIPSMVWAGIITIATYPLYTRWKVLFGRFENTSAFIFTFLLSLLFILPFSWLLTLLVKEIQVFINYTQTLNREGGNAPYFFQHIPVAGNYLVSYWDEHIGQPGYLVHLVSGLGSTLSPMSYYLKQIGVVLAHRSIQVGFTVLTLFFFYRDGDRLFQYINEIGQSCLNERWSKYVDRLPSTLRSTVNGTILVGLGVGVCMGICYQLLHFPTPTLTGFITAFAAMVPFLVPLVFLIVALIFIMSGNVLAAVIVLVWGTIVMFVADHFIKPSLIGGAIQLPFLAVLFGILGGLETLGFLGLFVGPIILVLFITLCQELKGLKHHR